MAKQHTFADKMSKIGAAKGAKCPVCDTVFQPILLVTSERSQVTKSWAFNERNVKVCKCNEKQIYG